MMITDERNWKEGVRLWSEMFEPLHLKTDVPEDDPCYYEKLCRAIIDAIQVLRTQVVLLIHLTDFLLRD